MDFKEENINLGLLEKNKQRFIDMAEENADTQKEGNDFVRYTEFMQEKVILLKLLREIESYSLATATQETFQSEHFKCLKDVIEYKNRIIMIVSF